MNVGLVGPVDSSINGNPGWHMITNGIRHLVRCALIDEEVVFTPINMLAFDESWAAAKLCDRLIVCGNPRFTMSTGNAFWENGIFDELLALRVPVIDGWAGSAFPHNEYNATPAEMAAAIRAFPGRQERLEQAAQFHGRITRDMTMQVLYESVGAKSVLLPCSSWWAAQNLPDLTTHRHDAVVLHKLDGMGDVLKRVCAGWRMLATTWTDYMWALEVGLDPELVADAESLLRIFYDVDRLLSFRIHASIPAASVGCRVVTVAIDSRADSVQLFDMEVVRFSELAEAELDFRAATTPSYIEVTETLKGMLC